MKYLFAAILTVTLSPAFLRAEESIPKWCKGDKLIYTFEDMKQKGFSECGVLSTVKLCDPAGNRVIGNVSARGVLKDCKIGPRISVTRHDMPLSESYDKGFAYNDSSPGLKPVSASAPSPMGKVEDFKNSTQSYFENYGQYLDSLEKMIDGHAMPKGVENKFSDSKNKLGEASKILSELQLLGMP